MKIIKKLWTIWFVFSLTLCMSIPLVGCRWMEEKEARARIKNCFEIEVPQEAKMVYNHYQSWQESTGYTVFIFEKEPLIWLNESGFFKEKDEAFERKAKESIDNFFRFSNRTRGDGGGCSGEGVKDLSQEYVPNFEQEYFWKEDKRDNNFNSVVLIYVPEKMMLVFSIETW